MNLAIRLLLVSVGICGVSGVASAQDGDPAMGQRVFARCMACHSLEADTHRVGPSLDGLWGRQAGSIDDFTNYSDAMRESGIVWMPEILDAYLANVRETVPGTNMALPNLTNADQRAHLIAYLIQELGEPPAEDGASEGSDDSN